MTKDGVAWNHKDLWRHRTQAFCVEISRHSVQHTDSHRGEHRWAVYAYLYPEHPRFPADAVGDDAKIWRGIGSEMPLHGGPSFVRVHRDNEGTVCSVQVGADYDHDTDQRYTWMATKDDAAGVFRDAELLIEWLKGDV